MKKLLLLLLTISAYSQLQAQNIQPIQYFDDSRRLHYGEFYIGTGVSPSYTIDDTTVTAWRAEAAFGIYITNNLSLGLQLSFLINDKMNCFIPMVYGKYHWLNTKYCVLYSGIGIGANIYSIDGSVPLGCIITPQQGTLFAYQLSPIGIELGHKVLWFYTELGFEYEPVIKAGLKVKF